MANKKILMVAAENDALPGAKVGGVADVMRDLPQALRKKSCDVDCVIPSYGFLHRLTSLKSCGFFAVEFGLSLKHVELLKLSANKQHGDIYILHHADFSPKGETVYCHDDDNQPFATDATKFAFFCAAVAKALFDGKLPRPDILHCHDWHAAFLLILLRSVPHYQSLNSIHTVFSIHNLAMQGVRPLAYDNSSFDAWFPGLTRDVDVSLIADPVLKHCINPMRAGILLADKIHTVSPSYAQEILHESDHEQGIFGGEGLENDLQQRYQHGDLFGILNGCEYPKKVAVSSLAKPGLVKYCENALLQWAAQERVVLSAHWLADKRLKTWAAKRNDGMLMTSVGRVTEQKIRLLTSFVAEKATALDAILEQLGNDGTFIMIGSGDKQFEQELVKISSRHKNFIFLNGFALNIADALYRLGDLFLMPSSFEPCGISQLLAMRAGQPCLVNKIGGLKDTVVENKTGFVFSGENAAEQAKAMVNCFTEALRVYKSSPEVWQHISKEAKRVRFSWSKASDEYLSTLYAC